MASRFIMDQLLVVIRSAKSIFLMVGTATVIIDFLTYFLLMYLIEFSPFLAKGLSFALGATFSYFMNKRFTFHHKKMYLLSSSKFICLYFSTLAINIGLNNVTLSVLQEQKFVHLIGFFVATGASTIFNFIGMKYYVFAK